MTCQFVNGKWFDGSGFRAQTVYAVDGLLTRKKPARVDETTDLENGFVIPPFADAHTHNLDGARGLDPMIKAYLDEGTFYVQVLGNYRSGAKQARPFLNKPSSLDVVYANGMLTCTYGHPFMVYEPMAMGMYNPADAYKKIPEIKKSRRAENDVYWFLDTRADVDAKWGKILAARPDVIKISLLNARDYDKYAAAGETLDKGLSPQVAAYVVQKAHQAGLRVYAHVETASDFRIGLDIGVDGFAHCPHYGWDGKSDKPDDDLTLADIKRAARQKTVVIPTAHRSVFSVTDFDAGGKGTLSPARKARVVERHKKLFNEMHENGVRLALGLDLYGQTLRPELEYFHENRIFDNRTLLKIAVETTPQALFPARKIGKLADGCEASFLVLGGSPLDDFRQTKNIKKRFKQGVFLPAGAAKA